VPACSRFIDGGAIRRALDGGLDTLADQWRVAEQIAGISDNLLTPAAHEAFLARHRAEESNKD
jgi:hypothetical protein